MSTLDVLGPACSVLAEVRVLAKLATVSATPAEGLEFFAGSVHVARQSIRALSKPIAAGVTASGRGRQRGRGKEVGGGDTGCHKEGQCGNKNDRLRHRGA